MSAFFERAAKTVRRLASVGLALCAVSAATAKPADPRPRTYTQPDGTKITLRHCGDEHLHYYLTDDGHMAMLDADDTFYYITLRDGALAKSTDRVGSTPPATAASITDSHVQQALQRRATTTHRRAPRRGPGLFDEGFPCQGSPKVLVILVDYPNKPFTLDDPHDYFERMLNQEGFSDYGATGSALQYFDDNSDGQFKPQFDLYGPVTLAHNYSYYGGNDWWGDDERPWEMIIEACGLLDDTVDFKDYDTNGDGYIDNVYVFYAGKGEASGGAANTVWPHSWNIQAGTGQTHKYDGKILDRYACSNEWEYNAPDGIGTFVHEFSHVMGLPDLYATDYSSAFTPGEWSILDVGPYNNDGRTPPCYGAFERYALDWMQPRVIDGPADITLAPVQQGDACIIHTPKSNEYYLLENRQQQGWDRYIPGHGMLVWHIDYNASVWESNSVNNTASHQYVDLVEADNTRTEGSRAGDAFPGTAKVTSFTDDTKPSMRTWSGAALGLPITEITETEGLITFKVCGGAETGPTFDQLQPVALEATGIGAEGFTANWEPLDDAIEYFIDVYSIGNASVGVETCDFAGGIAAMPTGWHTTSSLTYGMSSNCGQAIPSLRLSGTDAYVSTPVYDFDVTGISFWHRGVKAPEANDIRVYALVDGEWQLAATVAIESAAGGAVTEIDELPAGTRSLKIEYNAAENAGSVAIDDITVSVVQATLVAVDGYRQYSAGGALQCDVDGLQPDTEYRYVVTASDGELMSLPSQPVAVRTIRTTALDQLSARTAVSAADGRILVSAVPGTRVSVCDMQGRQVARSTTGASGRVIIHAAPGVYIVRVSDKASKIILR